MYCIQTRPFFKVKWSKFFRNDKNAGWNKSAGRNFFQKLIKVQDVIRLCRLEFSEKLISYPNWVDKERKEGQKI